MSKAYSGNWVEDLSMETLITMRWLGDFQPIEPFRSKAGIKGWMSDAGENGITEQMLYAEDLHRIARCCLEVAEWLKWRTIYAQSNGDAGPDIARDGETRENGLPGSTPLTN